MSEAATFPKVRWKRVLSANPCAFCRMLAGRGAVYSEGTASFLSHDHCSCTAEPEFSAALKVQPIARTPADAPITPVQPFETLKNDALAMNHIFKGLQARPDPVNDTMLLTNSSATRAYVKEAIAQNLSQQLIADPEAVKALDAAGVSGARELFGVEKAELRRLRALANAPGGELSMSAKDHEMLIRLERIAQKGPVDEEVKTFVSDKVHGWAITSNKTPEAELLQRAAVKEFSLSETAGPFADNLGRSALRFEERFAKEGPATQVLLRKMYETTQARFKAEGVTHVRLFRGFNLDANPFGDKVASLEGTTTKVKLRPLSSFSANGQTAAGFAGNADGYVMSVDVPVERILATARTGLGCLTEEEYVVLGGGDTEALVIGKSFFRQDPTLSAFHSASEDMFKMALKEDPAKPFTVTNEQWAKMTKQEQEMLIPF